MKITIGQQIRHQGGYRAGYEALIGKVLENWCLPETHYEDDFIESEEVVILPEGNSAIIQVWNGDCVSREGWRSLGLEGTFRIFKDGTYEESK